MAYKSQQLSRATGKASGIRTVKVATVMKSAAFRKGFNDVRSNRPFDYDYVDKNLGEAWRYERGRLLAIVYKGELKKGNSVYPQAITAYVAAQADHEIF